MFVSPFSKESLKILKQLSNNGKAFTFDSETARNFGKKHKNLFNRGFLDVASTRYSRRKDKTFFLTPPDVIVIPKYHKKGINFHFKRF